MSTNNLKDKLIQRLRELHDVEAAKKEYLTEARESIKELKSQIGALLEEIDRAERQELVSEIEASLDIGE